MPEPLDFPPAPGLLVMDSKLIHASRTLLEGLGLDISSGHGVDTPTRLVDTLRELTMCSSCDGDCIKWKTFKNDGMDEMIVVENIPFTSLYNHHVLPFINVAHIAYVPDERIAGLSKFSRTVEHFARTLQVQERLTAQIGDYLEMQLSPRGTAVVMRAEHLCMTIRGAQAPGAMTTTAYMRGVFKDHERTAKAEFLAHIYGSH